MTMVFGCIIFLVAQLESETEDTLGHGRESYHGRTMIEFSAIGELQKLYWKYGRWEETWTLEPEDGDVVLVKSRQWGGVSTREVFRVHWRDDRLSVIDGVGFVEGSIRLVWGRRMPLEVHWELGSRCLLAFGDDENTYLGCEFELDGHSSRCLSLVGMIRATAWLLGEYEPLLWLNPSPGRLEGIFRAMGNLLRARIWPATVATIYEEVWVRVDGS
ncbi:MAG: hypothetical protein VYA34_05690 [Myxococcota bacterium]|nr:hypothetical protein [Myxococcota bacterium]